MTTVPFVIANKSKKYDYLSSMGKMSPVFEQIPTQEDFFIAVKDIEWNGYAPRVIIDLGIVVLQVSYNTTANNWTILHQSSITEFKTEYCLVTGLDEYELVIQFIRDTANKFIEEVESLLRKTKRAIN